MTKNIRSVLSPLLTISYVFGLKIVEFPIYQQRSYFSCLSLLYMLFFWSVYYFLLRFTIIPYITVYSTVYHVCLYVDIFTLLLSIVVGVYHNKKFRSCLKKLTIVDDTLEKLGMTTDYHKLYMRTIWLLLSWIAIILLLTYLEALWLQNDFNYDITLAIYIAFMINYCSHLNFINNLIFTGILRCIKLKFDQVNEILQNLTKDKRGITAIWEDPMLHSHQRKFPKVANNEWLICVLMHLHLELCKISREIDSIFGIQMTVSIGCYFCWLAHSFYDIINVILINDYINVKIVYVILIVIWCLYFIFKLLFINYVCEEISIKANATGDLINRISSNCDVDRENISQFLLQIAQAPLKFYGLGLFQFGYKVFHDFFKYAATIIVIFVQMHTNK